MNKKFVFSSSAIPDECVRHAQVAIITEATWHLIGPEPYRAHGVMDVMPMPVVTCPVVDIRLVQDEEKMALVMNSTTDRAAGVINMSGLLTGLEALGAKVRRPIRTVISNQLSVRGGVR